MAASVNAKVGRAVPPFTEDFSAIDEVGVDNEARTFTHTQTLLMADAQAGVALQLGAIDFSGSSTVCFDNISPFEAK